MELIELKGVTRSYSDPEGNIFCALDNVSLIWNEGQSIAIMGESGSGRSTLARILTGLECPSKGAVYLNGNETTKWTFSEWRKHRSDIQAVFQDAGGTLNYAWSTEKNIEEALYNLTNLSSSQCKEKILEMMGKIGLRQQLLKTPVCRLSSGKQRRLALLRSLSVSPKFLILDEVTAGLDLISSEAVLKLLEKYQRDSGCTYMVITHDIQLASRLCTVIYKLEHGKITQKAVR